MSKYVEVIKRDVLDTMTPEEYAETNQQIKELQEIYPKLLSQLEDINKQISELSEKLYTNSILRKDQSCVEEKDTETGIIKILWNGRLLEQRKFEVPVTPKNVKNTNGQHEPIKKINKPKSSHKKPPKVKEPDPKLGYHLDEVLDESEDIDTLF